jgi:hypothetical protein
MRQRLLKKYSCIRFYSSDYGKAKKAPADPILPSSAEMWNPASSPQPDSTDSFFQHPLYTPPASPDVGLGPLKAPLRWPKYDQRTPSAEASGLPSPPHWRQVPFDHAASAPIGTYPHVTPQWSQLKDPFGYWDQQGRRNYGEVLYDHENFTEVWSIGPEIHWWKPFVGTAKVFGTIGFMAFLVYLWDPSEHLWFVRHFFSLKHSF